MPASQRVANKLVMLAVALVVWAAFFYTLDQLIMAGQGLPVRINLMPV